MSILEQAFEGVPYSGPYDHLSGWEKRAAIAADEADEARFRQAIADALAEPGRIVEYSAWLTRQQIRATAEGRVERRFVLKKDVEPWRVPGGIVVEPDGSKFSQWADDIPRRFLPPSAGGMMQHTADTWFADGCVVLDSVRRPVADCTVRGRSPVECAANAALIAAAPDLLDVLRAMVACIEMNNEGDPRLLSGWVTDARAAIAKAEGRKP